MRRGFRGFGSAESVEDAFYEALRQGDLAALMEIWADDDDVVCIHPGGERIEGLDAVRASWEEILQDGGMMIEPVRRHCTTGAALAVHHVVEAVQVREGGRRRVLHCNATNVFARDALGWRLIAHHASAPVEPEEGSRTTEAPGGVLH